MRLPLPQFVLFEGQHFDFGHQYGISMTVLINERYQYRNAVRLFIGRRNDMPSEYQIEIAREKVLHAFWRRLGAA